jgi:uncharacterized protein involved in exopolysaccharide biosynthesis
MNSIRPRTLADYVSSIKRRKLLILVTTLVVVIAAVIAIKRLRNVYESSTFILVDVPNSEIMADHPTNDLQHRLATVRQQITSRTRLQTLIDKHGLYQDMAAQPEDSVINRMRAEIDVDVTSSRPDATEAFTISYRARDPETAQAVTHDLAGQLIEDNVQGLESQASGESDLLRQRAVELSAELHQLEMKSPWLINLKEDSPGVPIAQTGGSRSGPAPDVVRTQTIAVGNIKDQQYKIEQQIADLDRRIAEQQRIVDHQKKSPVLRDNPVYGGLIAKRAELQGQKDNLVNQQGLTDKHPRVIAIQDQIASVNRAIADLQRQEAGRITQSAEERELATLQSDRNKLKVELEVTGRELGRQSDNPPVVHHSGGAVPAASTIPTDAGSARLAQDYLGLKQTYKDVTAKAQNAELKRQAIGSGKVEKFRILDEANLPQMPIWPNRRLFALIAAVAGLALGLGVALLVEVRRFPYLHDMKDVEYYTNLPLLAAIPKTQTPGETARERGRAGMKLVLGTAIAAAATFGLAKVLMLVHLFELLKK